MAYASSDSWSATLPSSYRQKSGSSHQPTTSSMLAADTAPHFPSESSFYTLRSNRHSFKSHIDTKPANTTVNLSTATGRPKLSSRFYKEMVPLSRKTLNNSDNVRTKIQRFEGITSQKENGGSCCKAYEVRELDSSPQQHHSKVRRSGTWNFHSPAPMQKQPSVQGGVRGGGTRKSNVHTHYTFHCPEVKSEVMHR